MMRVVHVIPSVARSDGGPAEVLRGIVPDLQRAGCEVRLVTTSKGNPTRGDFPPDTPTDVSMVRWPTAGTFAPSLAWKLWKAVGWADVVHVHSIHTFPTTIAMLICVLRTKPVVLQPHGALDLYQLRRRSKLKELYTRVIDRTGMRSVRSVIYNSAHELEDGEQFLPNMRQRNISLGVSEPLFGAEISRGDGPVVFISRIAPKKRLDLALRAFALLDANASKKGFVVAGALDTRLSFSPQRLSEELKIDGRVTFVGQVDEAQRAQLLARAALLVLPSDDESFGLAAAEAMAAGVPVVITANVGIATDAHGCPGVVITDQSPQSIAAGMRSVLDSSKPERREMARNVRSFARNNFRWSRTAEALREEYETVLMGK